MRVKETVIRPFGNSAGVTIPKEMLRKYSLEKGTPVALRETPDGILHAVRRRVRRDDGARE